MGRTAKRTAVLVFLIAAALGGCGDQDPEFARKALEAERKLSEAQAQLAEAREQLARCQGELTRAREKLAGAEDRADQLAGQLSSERIERKGAEAATEAVESDFYIAAAVSLSAVLAAFLLLMLLLRELAARKALVRFLLWIKRRGEHA